MCLYYYLCSIHLFSAPSGSSSWFQSFSWTAITGRTVQVELHCWPHSSASQSDVLTVSDSSCGFCIPPPADGKESAQPPRDIRLWKKFYIAFGNTFTQPETQMILLLKMTLVTLAIVLLCSAEGFLIRDQRQDGNGNGELGRTILEMLHINKVSATHQVEPHPYMTQIYQKSHLLEALDLTENPDGTLIQSFRSVVGPADAPPGWIWFNVSGLQHPLLAAAELVLYRKTLHPRPLSVNVTLHSVTASPGGDLRDVCAVEERLLELHQRSPSGYDVFNVTTVLSGRPLEVVGFWLQYTDEGGSLVLHEALTQTLYSVSSPAVSEPLLVFYQVFYPIRNV